MGVERGVATRRAQMVWPMMTVTVTHFEGFTRLKNLQKCEFWANSTFLQKLLHGEATVTVIIDHTI